MKSRSYRFDQALTGILLALLLSSAGCSNGGKTGGPNAANRLPAQPASNSAPVRKLVKEGGWKIPGLALARELQAPSLLQPVSHESTKVYSSWLRPQSGSDEPVVLRNYLSDEEIKALGITGVKLPVMVIVKYDLGDRPFCYIAKYRSTYALGALHYYDEDGDGKFELVETGSIDSEFIPRLPIRLQH